MSQVMNIRTTHWPDVSWNTHFSTGLWLVRINPWAKFHNKASGRQTKEKRKRPIGELTEWEASGSLDQWRSLSKSLFRPFPPECDSCIKNRANANDGNWTEWKWRTRRLRRHRKAPCSRLSEAEPRFVSVLLMSRIDPAAPYDTRLPSASEVDL